ncbi:MAG: NYN domain-containing protein, partial [Actinobacteria bacterium]|nr:NYN domain-containing protein [Actinomycetota bacterium]
SKEDIRVVSGDWEVQKGALMKRVERIPPRDFLAGMKNFAKKVAFSPEMDKMRWKLEHKVDVETLRRLEDMRRGRG